MQFLTPRGQKRKEKKMSTQSEEKDFGKLVIHVRDYRHIKNTLEHETSQKWEQNYNHWAGDIIKFPQNSQSVR